MDLSIVIPVYNEAHKISGDIAAAQEFLRDNGLTGEIIIVDDGSTDQTMAMASQGTSVIVLGDGQHHGKGWAVRRGLLAAQSRIVMFSDSGVCTPFTCALTGIRMIDEDECDLAHGSRKMTGSIVDVPQPFHRRLSSWLIHHIFIGWLGIPSRLTDTQCGFKLYRGSVAASLYGPCRTEGFLFDVEIILRALRLGWRIKEFPIQWRADHDSRLSTSRHFADILRELWTLKNMMHHDQEEPR